MTKMGNITSPSKVTVALIHVVFPPGSELLPSLLLKCCTGREYDAVWGCSSVVKYLLSMCNALHSIQRTENKKKRA
jgi:hypothetical protein